jgi:hypothetical protein
MMRKNSSQSVILRLDALYRGEGSAFDFFQPMQILRRLLAPQNDSAGGFIPILPGRTGGAGEA